MTKGLMICNKTMWHTKSQANTAIPGFCDMKKIALHAFKLDNITRKTLLGLCQ